MTRRLALVSVSNKEGLGAFGKALVDAGYTILSTGGTARALSDAGCPVTKVSSFTGAPEIFNGRVKTLHPLVHGGILGDRDIHGEEATEQGVEWIDLVVCNLYPFEKVTAQGAELATAVETIDIGGPTMVRAAAKNFKHVTVVVDPADYAAVAAEIGKRGGTSIATRQRLSVKAFRHTARYDAVISEWLAGHAGMTELPQEGSMGLRKQQELRYGENPHQSAAFYADAQQSGRSLARAVQHQGKALSFNNLADLDGALRTVFEFTEPACAIIKHMNPCGAATGTNISDAFTRALAGDPVSAFGGIVVFNRPVDGPDVRTVRMAKTFFEVLAAPGFTEDALTRLQGRKNLRVLELPADWADSVPPGRDARRVQGGWLLQDWDVNASMDWQVATDRAPTEQEARALRFAWRASRGVKSNAIVLARGLDEGAALNGVGAGQMSRVDAVHLAIKKATSEVSGCVLASDAFFPFADGIEAAAAAGVTAIVQPGGSVRDDEVIAAANAAGMTMVFTGKRHFRH